MPKLNFARLLEAAIIAVTSGVLAGYLSVNELKIEHKYLIQKNIEQDAQLRVLAEQTCGQIEKLRERIDRLHEESQRNGKINGRR